MKTQIRSKKIIDLLVKSRELLLIFSCLMLLACGRTANGSSQIRHNNFLKNTFWIIEGDKIVGLDKSDKEFVLSRKVDSVQLFNFAAIEFSDSVTFKSFNSWQCGNDCFSATFGHYKFIDKSKILCAVDSITHDGTCQQPTQYFKNPESQVFEISGSGNKLTLIKTQ